jgi:phosphoribosyl 1,2-cyclic phosphodiesterase
MSGERAILVDCGFGPRALALRLKKVGLVPEMIDALVLTHEHQDHAQGAERAQHKWRWPVYASAGTLAALPAIDARWRRPVRPGETVAAGAFTLESVAIPHDARAPLAFAVTATASGARLGVAHDLGAVPERLPALFSRCDALCLEANHDPEMLRSGPYPPVLQDRIRDGRGHLNNAQAGALAAQLSHRGLRAVALLHLSETNNTPALAAETVSRSLQRAAAPCRARAAAGRTPEPLFALEAAPAASQFQLAL